MMSRYDHYVEATRLLEDAKQAGASLHTQYSVAAAQAHAMLANYTGPMPTRTVKMPSVDDLSREPTP